VSIKGRRKAGESRGESRASLAAWGGGKDARKKTLGFEPF